MCVSNDAGEEPLNRWEEFMWGFISELIHLIEKLGVICPLSGCELKIVLQCADCLSQVSNSKEPNSFALLSLFLLKQFAK